MWNNSDLVLKPAIGGNKKNSFLPARVNVVFQLGLIRKLLGQRSVWFSIISNGHRLKQFTSEATTIDQRRSKELSMGKKTFDIFFQNWSNENKNANFQLADCCMVLCLTGNGENDMSSSEGVVIYEDVLIRILDWEAQRPRISLSCFPPPPDRKLQFAVQFCDIDRIVKFLQNDFWNLKRIYNTQNTY